MAEQGQQTVRESNYTEKHKNLNLASRTTETSRKFYCTDRLSPVGVGAQNAYLAIPPTDAGRGAAIDRSMLHGPCRCVNFNRVSNISSTCQKECGLASTKFLLPTSFSMYNG